MYWFSGHQHELVFSLEQVKFSITSLAHHQWILCSEWVPSEWESNDTYSLQMIHWWPSDAMLNLSKSVQMIKQTHLHLECLKSEYFFSPKKKNLVELFSALSRFLISQLCILKSGSFIFYLYPQVPVRGGTRCPETTRKSEKRRRKHAAAAFSGLKALNSPGNEETSSPVRWGGAYILFL